MLLESRIDEHTRLFIDAEAAGGFAKDDAGNDFRPEDVLDHVVRIATGVAGRVAESATELSRSRPVPSALEVRFGVKVQGDALVCLARSAEDAHFQVTVRWGG